jgi:hypothetical protein
MKMKFDFPNDAQTSASRRGAAPVGVLHELPPIELAAIVYMRFWCEGGADRQMIARDFRLVMGEQAGAAATKNFDELMDLLLNNARRPIMRHGLGCKCFGGDESTFAKMIAAEVGQDHDDAYLFASLLMTGHAAWSAIQVAGRLGQVFLRLARMSDSSLAPTHGHGPLLYKH